MRRREEELERELKAHLELEAEEQRQAGLSPDEARLAARRALGNPLLIKEDVRDTWRWASLEGVRQDLGYAFRMLRKAPGFTAVTLVSLALGIGLNSSVFSVLNALLLRPLPAAEPHRLVRIHQGTGGTTSYPTYRDLQARSTALQSLAVFSWPNPVGLSVSSERGEAPAEPVLSVAVSANYFDVLGVHAQLGRTFRAEEEQGAGQAPVAVLSDELWHSRFAKDPGVIGRSVRINGHPFEVIDCTSRRPAAGGPFRAPGLADGHDVRTGRHRQPARAPPPDLAARARPAPGRGQPRSIAGGAAGDRERDRGVRSGGRARARLHREERDELPAVGDPGRRAARMDGAGVRRDRAADRVREHHEPPACALAVAD